MIYTVICLALLPCLMASPMLEMMEMTKARHINQIVDQGAPIEHIFKAFVDTHGKTYKNEDEVTMRKAILAVNVEHIKSHNVLYAKGEKSYYLGVNQFSDLTHNEFLSQYTGHIKRNIQTNATTYLSPSFVTLPDTVDWRTKGYVTPVKNQGQCGSCWAFSTTGSLEGQNFKKKGILTSLSEQQLVDCSGSFGNEGCNGGLMDQGFEYIKSVAGIDDEADYPYEAQQEDKCAFKPKKEKAEVTGFVDVESGSEDKLKEAVGTVGPISIAIDASHSSFQSYAGGVYDEPECSSSELDHGVLVVGYGTDEGSDFWLVKNSWGETWGKEGYVQMSRNKDNQCGVATQASYPLV